MIVRLLEFTTLKSVLLDPINFSNWLSLNDNVQCNVFVSALVNYLLINPFAFIKVVKFLNPLIDELFPCKWNSNNLFYIWLKEFSSWDEAYKSSPINSSNFNFDNIFTTFKNLKKWFNLYFNKKSFCLFGLKKTKEQWTDWLKEQESWENVFDNMSEFLGNINLDTHIELNRVSCLGCGASGEVAKYKISGISGINRFNGIEVVAKFFYSKNKDFKREVKIYEKLRLFNQNDEEKEKICSLNMLLHDVERGIILFSPVGKPFDISLVKKEELKKFVNILQLIHTKLKIVHMDIRIPNIILIEEGKGNWKLLLIDWGKSKEFGKHKPERVRINHASQKLLEFLCGEGALLYSCYKMDETFEYEYGPADDLGSFVKILLTCKGGVYSKEIDEINEISSYLEYCVRVKYAWDKAIKRNAGWKEWIEAAEKVEYMKIMELIDSF
jgi:hypothetical protein